MVDDLFIRKGFCILEKDNNKRSIRSLEKGISIIKMFVSHSRELSLSEIALAQKMPLGTCHRYLNTFINIGYIRQSMHSKKYKLTAKILELSFQTMQNMGFRKRVLPYLVEISGDFNVTTASAVLDGTEIVFVDRIPVKEIINLDLSTGSRLPAYCTSMGKAILAFTEKEKREELIEKTVFIPHTQYTIIDKEKLREDLALTRERGFSINNQEVRLGLCSIAIPIFNNGEVEGSISFCLNKLEGSELEKTLLCRFLKIAEIISL